MHGIERIFSNCIQAIHARICFIQRYEESSNYIPAINWLYCIIYLFMKYGGIIIIISTGVFYTKLLIHLFS